MSSQRLPFESLFYETDKRETSGNGWSNSALKSNPLSAPFPADMGSLSGGYTYFSGDFDIHREEGTISMENESQFADFYSLSGSSCVSQYSNPYSRGFEQIHGVAQRSGYSNDNDYNSVTTANLYDCYLETDSVDYVAEKFRSSQEPGFSNSPAAVDDSSVISVFDSKWGTPIYTWTFED